MAQPGSTVVVTDSTASLPPEVAARHGIEVVPLQVVIGSRVLEESLAAGDDPALEGTATPAVVAEALRSSQPVSTSRPPPAVLHDLYERLAAQGAREIVSIHLSGEVSGTYESAQLAARDASVPVTTVDTRQVGVATGYAARTAALVLAEGGTAAQAAAAARDRATRATSLFYVDTLEYLRRGGRVGAAAALLGGALSVKPLLGIVEGRVETREKVRTSARALARLEELAVEAAGEDRGEVGVEVCVAHLAAPDRAAALADRLADRLEGRLAEDVWCAEVGAVLGAHVGPGMVAVCVAPR